LSVVDMTSLLSRWSEASGGAAVLVNHSENRTFRVTAPSGMFSLRLHRPGYQSGASIRSELAWLSALRRDTSLPVPSPVPGRDGRLLQEIEGPDGETSFAVLFDHIEGVEPDLTGDRRALFRVLGGFAAHLHEHATQWTPPQDFTRQVWSAGHILDADGLWGDWRVAPGVDAGIGATLHRLDGELRLRLAEYGTEPGRFGLIHADMRLGNLLLDGDRVTLIDFDDCGFCWFAYDFAAVVSFHETHPAIPALKTAWIEGYRQARPLSDADIAIIDAMILLRRMALLAWIGSHNETALAQTHMPGFAAGTAMLAERFLAAR
jgi:Ser/Thr protein kinase RdoA (MazF antagonist)